MPKGNLVVHLSDMAGELAKRRLDIDLKRVPGASGAGGENMVVSVAGPVGVLTDLANSRSCRGLAVDIDIDEASGIEHGFEVIRNAVFRRRTNPYLIREFMNAADSLGHSLSPDYRFTF